MVEIGLIGCLNRGQPSLGDGCPRQRDDQQVAQVFGGERVRANIQAWNILFKRVRGGLSFVWFVDIDLSFSASPF